MLTPDKESAETLAKKINLENQDKKSSHFYSNLLHKYIRSHHFPVYYTATERSELRKIEREQNSGLHMECDNYGQFRASD